VESKLSTVELSKVQYEYLQNKYLESLDIYGDSTSIFEDGFITKNERIALERFEQETQGTIKSQIGVFMICNIFEEIEQRFIADHGHDEEEYEDFPLMDGMEHQ